MKKYILFQYDDYYPGGGLGDIVADSDDLEELKEKVSYADNAYIVDRDTWQAVWDQDGSLPDNFDDCRYLMTGYVDGATINKLMDAYEHLLKNNKHLEDNSTPYCWGIGLTISTDMPGQYGGDLVNITLVVSNESESKP